MSSESTRRSFVISCECGITVVGAVAGDTCGNCGRVVLDG